MLGGEETPGGLELGPGTTYSDRAEQKYLAVLHRVDEALGLQRVDDEVVNQGLVEEVVAHDAGGGVRDAAGDDPVAGAVHVPELVAGRLGDLNVMKLGGDLADLGEADCPPAEANAFAPKATTPTVARRIANLICPCIDLLLSGLDGFDHAERLEAGPLGDERDDADHRQGQREQELVPHVCRSFRKVMQWEGQARCDMD